jgi:hypothetical protein
MKMIDHQIREAGRARIRAGIDSVAGKNPLGMPTDHFMAGIRGPYPDVPCTAPEIDNG